MVARRAVAFGKRAEDEEAVRVSRGRVGDVKFARGERGEPWWGTSSDQGLRGRTVATIRALLRCRGTNQSISVDEVAKVVGGKRLAHERHCDH